MIQQRKCCERFEVRFSTISIHYFNNSDQHSTLLR